MNHPHLEALNTRHRDIDTRIHDEERRPHGDEVKITDLKKEKLKLKEEIQVFEASLE